jgi:hypothetical protein
LNKTHTTKLNPKPLATIMTKFMKRITIIVMTLLLMASCGNDDTIEPQRQFVVDEIFDYNNNLLAKYIYNDNNQLIKRITTDPINERSSDYEFEYLENRISKIKYIDYTFPQFNHTILVYYNQQGQIEKDETYKGNNLIGIKNYSYYANGKIKGIIDNNGEENITYIYNNTNNIEQVKIRFLDNGDVSNTDEYIEKFYDYEYDSGNKPNFGINNIFQFEPLPYFGTEAMFEKNISLNNMTKNITTGTKWIYEYNKFNLPKRIETKWDGVDTEEPMLLRIEYKEIE